MSKCALWSVAPFASVVLAACGGTDGANEERRAQAGASPQQTQQLTLTGCVQAGTANTAFVLENVRTSDRREDATAQPSIGGSIAEGSSVQLRSADGSNLAQYVGREVKVTGTIADTRDDGTVVGTGGSEGRPSATGEKSRAEAKESASEKVRQEAGPIGRQSLARGTAPELAVQQIEPTGNECRSGMQPKGRD